MSFTEGYDDVTKKDFGGIERLTVRYREEGEIFVYNDGDNNAGFAICYKCGFADSEKKERHKDNIGRTNLPDSFVKHIALDSDRFSRACWNNGQTPVLRHQTLANKDITDVVMFDFSPLLALLPNQYNISVTLGIALKLAGTQLLELDSREVGVFMNVINEYSHGIILYDTSPGGSGHVYELMKKEREWLVKAQEILERGNLITFDTQTFFQKGLIDIEGTKTILGTLLKGESLPTQQQNISEDGFPMEG